MNEEKETAGQRIVALAREWLNTPFGYGQDIKGLGVDCIKLVENAAGDPASMGYVASLNEALPGDLLALCDAARRFPDEPRHLVIVSEVEPYLKGIHAAEAGVREHRLDSAYTQRIHSIWRVGGVEREDTETTIQKRIEFRGALERGEVNDPITLTIFGVTALHFAAGVAVSVGLAVGGALLTRALTPHQTSSVEKGRQAGQLVINSELGILITEIYSADPNAPLPDDDWIKSRWL